MSATACRLCLEGENFSDLSETREGLPISVLAMIICPIKIEFNDFLPKIICEDCLTVILQAYKLREVSNNTDRYLRSHGVESEALDETIEVFKENLEGSAEVIQVFKRENDTAGPSTELEVIDEEMTIMKGDDLEEVDKDDYIVYDDGDYETTTTYDSSQNVNEYRVLLSTESRKSPVWNFFGFLADVNFKRIEAESNYFFCKICVEKDNTIKPKYKIESTSTSVLMAHLSKIHNISKSDIVVTHSVTTLAVPVQELVNCEICNKTVNSGSLSLHMGIEHQDRAECRTRDKSSSYIVNCFKQSSKSLAWDYFGLLQDLEGNQLDNLYFYCKLCVEEENKLSPKYTKNTSTSILLQHLKTHIPKSPEELAKRKLPEPITISTSKRFKTADFSCKVCGETLESTKSLNKHLLKEHNEEQPRDFTCEDCNKSFTHHKTLKTHIKNVHESDRFKHPCSQCPAMLSSQPSLRRHLDSCHLKIRSHICDICNAPFSELKSLRNHVEKVHLGIHEKKVPCYHCELAFPNQWSLKRHMLTHTGEKPHKCQYCELSYASKGDLVKHLSKLHDVTVYNCHHAGCGLGFRLRNELRDHFKVHFLGEQEDTEEQAEFYEVISEEFINE